MAKTFIGVREVDEETFREFRAKAIQEKMKLGIALTKAMQKYIEENKQTNRKTGVDALMKVKPFDFGPGTENLSNEIDEIVYGTKK